MCVRLSVCAYVHPLIAHEYTFLSLKIIVNYSIQQNANISAPDDADF